MAVRIHVLVNTDFLELTNVPMGSERGIYLLALTPVKHVESLLAAYSVLLVGLPPFPGDFRSICHLASLTRVVKVNTNFYLRLPEKGPSYLEKL